MIRTPAAPYDTMSPGELGNPPGWWGMLFLVFTEAALFASLLLSYFYERANAVEWPPAGIEKPELILPLIMTALLIGSSITMLIAETAIKRDSQTGLIVGLVLSVLLAGGFLAMQGYEYTHTDFALGDSVYSSAFFTITGLHGIHVAIAVLMGLVLIARASLGHFTARNHNALRNVSLYWHFVDLVWLFILASLYISPHVL
ncbi:MAG TPA: cytochrome c oxidase subunit 3 [Thermomicrobiales bacterium]|nr:cytochrome c oxidase subunit 3 [Thermomicrobiales bacterium]